jgi:hypothetical protein
MAVRLAFIKLMLLIRLFFGFRQTPPVTAAERASLPMPCWLSYPTDEGVVVPLPDRTPWQPRWKAGEDGPESLGSRRSALSVTQVTCQSGHRGGDMASRGRPAIVVCPPPQRLRRRTDDVLPSRLPRSLNGRHHSKVSAMMTARSAIITIPSSLTMLKISSAGTARATYPAGRPRTRRSANAARAQVGCRDDRLLAVGRPVLRVGEAAVFGNLQQRVRDVRVRFLVLVDRREGERPSRDRAPPGAGVARWASAVDDRGRRDGRGR